MLLEPISGAFGKNTIDAKANFWFCTHLENDAAYPLRVNCRKADLLRRLSAISCDYHNGVEGTCLPLTGFPHACFVIFRAIRYPSPQIIAQAGTVMAYGNSETHYDVMQRNGVSRRDFIKFCSMTAAWLGLSPALAPVMAHALETKPRLPVIWIEGLSCSCCTESFIRSSHPLAKDIILNMISLDYNDVLMTASGVQAEAAFEEAIARNRGNYILAVEGNAPFGNDGMFCIDGGKPFLEKLRYGAKDARAVVAWGTCACWGCIQAARPNPTSVKPVAEIIHDKPVIKIPGCPPIPDVMSALVAYIITFDKLPELDSQGRFAAFYGQHVHDQCVRRAHFDAGEFVEEWDDEGARKGYCLYKMGCRGPTTFNACPNTRWNDGVSYPIESGHPCLGCSEQGFFDQGSFYSRIMGIPAYGTMATAQKVAGVVGGTVAGAVALHAAASAIFHLHEKRREEAAVDTAKTVLDEVESLQRQEKSGK